MNSDDNRIQQLQQHEQQTPMYIIYVALDHSIGRNTFTDSVYDIVDKINTPLSVNVINGAYVENSASYQANSPAYTYRQLMVMFNMQPGKPLVDLITARNAVFSLVEHFSTHYKHQARFYELPVMAHGLAGCQQA